LSMSEVVNSGASNIAREGEGTGTSASPIPVDGGTQKPPSALDKKNDDVRTVQTVQKKPSSAETPASSAASVSLPTPPSSAEAHQKDTEKDKKSDVPEIVTPELTASLVKSITEISLDLSPNDKVKGKTAKPTKQTLTPTAATTTTPKHRTLNERWCDDDSESGGSSASTSTSTSTKNGTIGAKPSKKEETDASPTNNGTNGTPTTPSNLQVPGASTPTAPAPSTTGGKGKEAPPTLPTITANNKKVVPEVAVIKNVTDGTKKFALSSVLSGTIRNRPVTDTAPAITGVTGGNSKPQIPNPAKSDKVGVDAASTPTPTRLSKKKAKNAQFEKKDAEIAAAAAASTSVASASAATETKANKTAPTSATNKKKLGKKKTKPVSEDEGDEEEDDATAILARQVEDAKRKEAAANAAKISKAAKLSSSAKKEKEVEDQTGFSTVVRKRRPNEQRFTSADESHAADASASAHSSEYVHHNRPRYNNNPRNYGEHRCIYSQQVFDSRIQHDQDCYPTCAHCEVQYHCIANAEHREQCTKERACEVCQKVMLPRFYDDHKFQCIKDYPEEWALCVYCNRSSLIGKITGHYRRSHYDLPIPDDHSDTLDRLNQLVEEGMESTINAPKKTFQKRPFINNPKRMNVNRSDNQNRNFAGYANTGQGVKDSRETHPRSYANIVKGPPPPTNKNNKAGIINGNTAPDRIRERVPTAANASTNASTASSDGKAGPSLGTSTTFVVQPINNNSASPAALPLVPSTNNNAEHKVSFTAKTTEPVPTSSIPVGTSDPFAFASLASMMKEMVISSREDKALAAEREKRQNDLFMSLLNKLTAPQTVPQTVPQTLPPQAVPNQTQTQSAQPSQGTKKRQSTSTSKSNNGRSARQSRPKTPSAETSDVSSIENDDPVEVEAGDEGEETDTSQAQFRAEATIESGDDLPLINELPPNHQQQQQQQQVQQQQQQMHQQQQAKVSRKTRGQGQGQGQRKTMFEHQQQQNRHGHVMTSTAMPFHPSSASALPLGYGVGGGVGGYSAPVVGGPDYGGGYVYYSGPPQAHHTLHHHQQQQQHPQTHFQQPLYEGVVGMGMGQAQGGPALWSQPYHHQGMPMSVGAHYLQSATTTATTGHGAKEVPGGGNNNTSSTNGNGGIGGGRSSESGNSNNNNNGVVGTSAKVTAVVRG
jgi:hypothetical protein